MIERKAFLQITKAMILGLRNSLTDPRVKIKQSILKELAEILGVERCVLFKIVCEGINGMVNGLEGELVGAFARWKPR